MTVLPFHVRVISTGEIRPASGGDRWGLLTFGIGWRPSPPASTDVAVECLMSPLKPDEIQACQCPACVKIKASAS